ncbi:ephrin-A4-like [Arapaima gigas]
MARGPSSGSPLAVLRIALLLLHVASPAGSRRHVVYWNSTNSRLARGDLSIQVNINDYLDIYCPHYPQGISESPPETLALYQVGDGQFRGCVETEGAIKRWECNRPYSPFGPVLFSEKIQKHSPFSKGLEFLPGKHYYYSSLPMTDGRSFPCLKLRISVCCESTSPVSKSVVQPPAPAPAAATATTPPCPLLVLLLLFLTAL